MTQAWRPAARALVTVAAAAVVGGACAYFTPVTEPYRAGVVPTTDPLSGERLYLRDCAWCHGSAGEGTARGPDLVTGRNGPASTDFMLSTGRMPIGSPEERTERSDPAYTVEARAAIVDYVATLGGTGPDIPTVDPAAGDLGAGLELYQENCAACHSTTLIGGALATGEGPTRGLIAPELHASSAREIAEAMLVGPGAMPVFGEDVFSPDEVDAIVAYVVALQDARDRGGAPIGHIGPVAEGAVGWIVGLGAVLIVARWIGTKMGEQ